MLMLRLSYWYGHIHKDSTARPLITMQPQDLHVPHQSAWLAVRKSKMVHVIPAFTWCIRFHSLLIGTPLNQSDTSPIVLIVIFLII